MNGPVIALYKPQIPPNTGNIARLCVAINSPLYIIGKTPIKWDDSSLKRAGLDHWQSLQFCHDLRLKSFLEKFSLAQCVAVTKSASKTIWEYSFQENEILLFGNETMGLPPALLKIIPRHIKIPMWGESVRSLNLSNSVAITAYEYIRQRSYNTINGEVGLNYARTYYKKERK